MGNPPVGLDIDMIVAKMMSISSLPSERRVSASIQAKRGVTYKLPCVRSNLRQNLHHGSCQARGWSEAKGRRTKSKLPNDTSDVRAGLDETLKPDGESVTLVQTVLEHSCYRLKVVV